MPINLAPFLISVVLPSQNLLTLHNRIFDMQKFEPNAFNPRALNWVTHHLVKTTVLLQNF